MEKQNEELYIYAVHPKKVIVIDGVGAIRSPKSLYLSKEDVLTCLKKASVYRRFPFGVSEKVNIDNIDRLHREKYMTEAEYNEYIKSEKSANHGYVYGDFAISSTEKLEDKNVQESSPINNNESTAEVETEKQTDAKSEIVDESAPSQENQENTSAQDNVMDDTEEVKENNENQKSQQTNEQYTSKYNNNNCRKNNKK